jgi:hypothetical protein
MVNLTPADISDSAGAHALFGWYPQALALGVESDRERRS